VGLFEGAELSKQAVILCVRDLRAILYVVEDVVTAELGDEPIDASLDGLAVACHRIPRGTLR